MLLFRVIEAVILAEGLGTRISEETQVRPKPMVEVGGRPVLWHIIETNSAHGIHEIVICIGYKGSHAVEFRSNATSLAVLEEEKNALISSHAR